MKITQTPTPVARAILAEEQEVKAEEIAEAVQALNIAILRGRDIGLVTHLLMNEHNVVGKPPQELLLLNYVSAAVGFRKDPLG